jgi:TolB protein
MYSIFNLSLSSLLFIALFSLPTNKSATNPIAPNNSELCSDDEVVHYPQEKHLTNVRQLTFGGDNAEAYFSFDSKMLTLQIANPKSGVECDQIFYGKIPQSPQDKFDIQMISTGKGRTTCSYFLPGDRAVLYASTHEADAACPHAPNWREVGKYVWSLYPSYEIYYTDLQGTLTQRLTNNNFYDAEATVSPDGNTIVFTSTRNGDIDLYTMDISGGNVKQITHELGYDGGAFFSPDGKQLVFRASRPQKPEAVKEYKDLLAKNLVAPSEMELFVCNVDGSNLRQITHLGGSNWAPYFHPSQQKIVFASNHHTGGKGFPFNLFMINIDGTGLEQITFDTTFDSFPMFSYDGKKIVFASNRNNGDTRDTNVFIADWVD